jgi:hypothetical protein
MTDVFVTAKYERLDGGLKRSLRRATELLGSIRTQLALAVPEQDESRLNLWRWGMLYAVILRDISRSADRLLVDGKHSRAVTVLRRIAFEYYTRFHYLAKHQEYAKTAMDDYNAKMKQFQKRVGRQNITLVPDPHFDEAAHKTAEKPYNKFYAVCSDVYGDSCDERYARFYSYPSALLHGDATMSIDVLELVDNRWQVHLDSHRAFTNEIAGNLIVFFLDFASDVCTLFDLKGLSDVRNAGVEFNRVRKRLGIEIE